MIKRKKISENQLRNKLTKFILFSYALIIFSLLVYNIIDWIVLKDFTVLIGLVSPIFSVYITAIVRYAVTIRDPQKDKQINHLLYILSMWAIPIHLVGVWILITLLAFRKYDIEELKVFFIFMETFFGVYIGSIITSLYKIDENQTNVT